MICKLSKKEMFNIFFHFVKLKDLKQRTTALHIYLYNDLLGKTSSAKSGKIFD